MGKGKENERKRMRTGDIKVECLLMEKKGGAFFLFVSVGFLLFFCVRFASYFTFCWFLLLLVFLLFFVWFCSFTFLDHNLC